MLKPTDEIKLEATEISQTKWLTIDEIKKSMKDKNLKWYPRPIQIIKAIYEK